ncbi:hypothetical protein Mext_0469 [Methylorubrum extorquens PA1]|nr:hypothetical protein Mext_0469 [Methylorubrum extorquens PA1]
MREAYTLRGFERKLYLSVIFACVADRHGRIIRTFRDTLASCFAHAREGLLYLRTKAFGTLCLTPRQLGAKAGQDQTLVPGRLVERFKLDYPGL